MSEEPIETPESTPELSPESTPEPTTEKFDVIYKCLRCGTTVTNTELSRLPEIKCICGFRVFTKVRPPLVKTLSAI